MKLRGLLLVVCSWFSFPVAAQPVWSPEKRAEMEMEWMRDSLRLTPTQAKKAHPVSLNYQKKMAETGGSKTKQHDLMQKKDGAMKHILNPEQYKVYYRREEEIRSRPEPSHSGKRQAY